MQASYLYDSEMATDSMIDDPKKTIQYAQQENEKISRVNQELSNQNLILKEQIDKIINNSSAIEQILKENNALKEEILKGKIERDDLAQRLKISLSNSSQIKLELQRQMDEIQRSFIPTKQCYESQIQQLNLQFIRAQENCNTISTELDFIKLDVSQLLATASDVYNDSFESIKALIGYLNTHESNQIQNRIDIKLRAEEKARQLDSKRQKWKGRFRQEREINQSNTKIINQQLEEISRIREETLANIPIQANIGIQSTEDLIDQDQTESILESPSKNNKKAKHRAKIEQKKAKIRELKLKLKEQRCQNEEMEQQLKDARQSVTDFEQRLKDSEMEIDRLKETSQLQETEMNTIQQSTQQLESELSGYKERTTQMESEISGYKERESKFEEEIERMRKEALSLTNEIAEAKEIKAALEAEMDRIVAVNQKSIDEFAAETQRLEQTNCAKDEQLKELEKHRQKMEETIEELEGRESEARGAVAQLSKRLKEAHRSLKKASAKQQKTEKLLSDTAKKLEEVHGKYREAQKSFKEIYSAGVGWESFGMRKELLDILKKSIDQSGSSLERYQRGVSLIVEFYENLIVETANEADQSAKNVIKELCKRTDRFVDNKNNNGEDEINSYIRFLEDYIESMRALEDDVLSFCGIFNMTTLSEVEVPLDKLISDNNRLVETINTLQEDVGDLERENEDLQSEIDNLNEEFDRARNEIERYKREINEEKAKREQLEDANNRLEDSVAQKESAIVQMKSDFEAERTNLKNSIEETKQIVAGLQTELVKSEREIESLNNGMKEKDGVIEGLEQKYDRLEKSKQRTVEAAKRLKSELAEAQAQYKEKKRLIKEENESRSQKYLEEIRKQRAECGSTVKALQEEIAGLQEEIEKLKSENSELALKIRKMTLCHKADVNNAFNKGMAAESRKKQVQMLSMKTATSV